MKEDPPYGHLRRVFRSEDLRAAVLAATRGRAGRDEPPVFVIIVQRRVNPEDLTNVVRSENYGIRWHSPSLNREEFVEDRSARLGQVNQACAAVGF